MILENREIEKMTYEEQIIQIIESKGKIFRKDLGKIIGIKNINNLNRDIDKLIKKGEIKKDKEGREVFYIAAKPDPILNAMTETLKQNTTPFRAEQLPKKTVKHKWDLITDCLKREGREMTRQEIIKKTGIADRNIDRYFKRLMKTKQIIRRQPGKIVFYRLSDTPFNPQQQEEYFTDLDVFINRIPSLTKVCDYKRYVRRQAEGTITNQARHVVKFYRWKSNALENGKQFRVHPVELFTLQDVTDYFRFLEEGEKEKKKSDNTLKTIQTALKSYFRDCKRLKIIPENILKDVATIEVETKKGVDINLAEFKQMVAVAPTFAGKTLLFVALDTGARISEIQRMSIPDIDFEAKKITIHESKKKRKGATRTIDVSQITLDHIQQYMDEFRPEPKDKEDNAVFISEKSHRRLCKKAINNMMIKIRTLAGMTKQVTIHSMRRACARMLWERGMLIEAISKRLGHNRIQTTWGYINPREAFLTEQYQKAHPLEDAQIVTQILTGVI